jgi:hypothetical protein
MQLRKLKCQYGQGYLFSRPVDADSIDAWISHKPHWQETLYPTTNQFLTPIQLPIQPAVVQLRTA